MEKNILNVPVFLKADTDTQLIKEMYKNNAKDDKEYQYSNINKVGNLWYAWYIKDFRTITPKQIQKKKGKKK